MLQHYIEEQRLSKVFGYYIPEDMACLLVDLDNKPYTILVEQIF